MAEGPGLTQPPSGPIWSTPSHPKLSPAPGLPLPGLPLPRHSAMSWVLGSLLLSFRPSWLPWAVSFHGARL